MILGVKEIRNYFIKVGLDMNQLRVELSNIENVFILLPTCRHVPQPTMAEIQVLVINKLKVR